MQNETFQTIFLLIIPRKSTTKLVHKFPILLDLNTILRNDSEETIVLLRVCYDTKEGEAWKPSQPEHDRMSC